MISLVNVAHAAEIDTFIRNVNAQIINPLISLLVALALALFIIGVVEFIAGGDSEEKRTKGKNHILWGLVGLVIMLGVWGILGFALDTFGITEVDPEAGTVNLPY